LKKKEVLIQTGGKTEIRARSENKKKKKKKKKKVVVKNRKGSVEKTGQEEGEKKVGPREWKQEKKKGEKEPSVQGETALWT